AGRVDNQIRSPVRVADLLEQVAFFLGLFRRYDQIEKKTVAAARTEVSRLDDEVDLVDHRRDILSPSCAQDLKGRLLDRRPRNRELIISTDQPFVAASGIFEVELSLERSLKQQRYAAIG